MKKIIILSTLSLFLLSPNACFSRNLDGTGPNGQGPRTGKGLGPCNKNSKNTGCWFGQGRAKGNRFNQKLDGTGPNGQGPRTGKGLGPCNK